MKILVAMILLAGLAIDSSVADDFCKGKKDGHYTYPPNCNKFYQCSNERTFVMPCPASLWFSPVNDTCERPADIKPKPKCKAPSLLFDLANDDFCKGKKDGHYTYPPNCNKFYQCSNERTFVMPCPASLWFSPVNDTCERPADIKPKPKCKAPAALRNAVKAERPTPQFECRNNQVGGVPHASVCAKFVLCTGNGLGVVKSCKNETNFDPDLRVCVWKSLYDCKGPNFCKGKIDGIYAHSSLCDRFFQCVAGLTYTQKCPTGLYFNSKKTACDYPSNVKRCPGPVPTTVPVSTKTTTQTASTKVPTNPQTKPSNGPLAGFCKGKQDGNYEHPWRCDLFVSCVAQKVIYIRNCPAGLYYNKKTDQCDWPRNVNCPKPTTSNPTTQSPTITTTTTQPPTTTTTTTTTTKTTTTQTPTTTTTTTTTTEPPTTTTTTTEPPTTTTTTTEPPTTTTTTAPKPTNTTTKAPTSPSDPLLRFCKGKQDGNYKHPSRCDLFVSCVAQKVIYIRNCPAGLYYNKKTDQCDWPRNVNCKNTPQATTKAPTTKPPTYCDGKAPGLYPKPAGQCDSYVICTPDGIYHMKCPTPMLFDKIKKSCQLPDTVDCNGTAPTTIAAATTAAITPTSGNVKCNGVGGFPIAGSCTQYVSCGADGIPKVKTCPKATNFHPKYGVCVHKDSYPCRNGKHNNFCHDKKDGNYVDPSRCDGYLACSGSLRFSMKCPDGLWYDVRQDACDYPHNVQCNAKTTSAAPPATTGTTTTKPSTQQTTTIAPAFCQRNGEGNHADQSRCDTYISCDKSGRGVRMACPSGLYYNSQNDTCDYPNNVQCTIQAQRDISEFSCNGRRGSYPSEFGCNTFYECDGSARTPQVKTCRKHHNFHAQHKKCVWSYSFSCEDPEFCVGRVNGKYTNRWNCYGYYQCDNGATFPRNCPAMMRFNGRNCVPASQFVCHGTVVV